MNNVASAGDYKDIDNAAKGVNAGDLNNAVLDATEAATNKGLKFGNGAAANQYKLGDAINVHGSADGSISSTLTGDGVVLGLGSTVKIGSGMTQITVDGTAGKIGGLSNKAWNAASITSGQAATEDQLKAVSDAQTLTDAFAVKYDKNADGSVNKDSVTFAGTSAVKTKAVNGRITTIDGTSLNNVASAGDYKDIVNADKGVNNAVLDAAGSVKNIIGGSTTVNADGSISNSNIGGTGASTIDGAIKNVSTAAKAAKTEVKKGDNIEIAETTGADGQSIYTVATAKAVNFDSVTVGGVVINKIGSDITGLSNTDLNAADFASKGRAATEEQLKLVKDAQDAADAFGVKYDKNADGSVNKDSVTFAGTSAVKTKAVNGRISTIGGTSLNNVASAGDYKDVANADKGVNAGDLNNAVLDAAGSVKNIIGGSTTVNADGSISNSNIGGTGASTIDGAIKNVSTAAKAAKTEVKKGDNIEIAETTGADGQSIYTVATAKAVNFDSVTVGGVVINKIGSDITGLSNTDLNAADFASKGRAATEEQLKLVKDAQDAADAFGVKYDKNADGSVNKDSVTFAGTSAVKTKAVNGRISTIGGTSLNNVASAGDYKDVANADKGVNAGDLNNAVLDAAGSVKNIIGGSTMVNADGSISNSNIGGTGASTIDGAIKTVSKAAKAAKTEVKKGDNIEIAETTGADGQNIYTVSTAKDLNLNSVMVNDGQGNITLLDKNGTKVTDAEGNASQYGAKGLISKNQAGESTVLNQNGLSFTDVAGASVGPSMSRNGINAGGVKILNVGSGTIAQSSQDAVNGSQISTIVSSIQNSIGGNTTVNNDGSITTSDIGGTGQSTIDDAIKSVKDLADQTNDFAVKYDKNADGTVNKDNVTFSGTKANSIQDADGRIDTVGGTSLNNVASAGDYKDVANASKAVNAGDLNNAILDASNHVKDIIGGNTKVNADGSISNSNIGGTGKATIDEAIAQVGNAAKAAKTEVTAGNNITVTNKGPGSNGQDVYEVATAADVSFDSITTKAVTVGDVKITENGINAGNKQINNVADGATNQDSKDAVNGSQLNATNQKVAEYLGGGAKFENGSWTAPSYTVGHGDTAQNFGDVGGAIDALNNADQALGNRITNLGDRLEQVFIDTNQKIDDVEKKANAGVAAAMALENAPFIAGKYTYAVGAAYHGGENAIGVTLRKTSDNGRWSLTGGIAAASQGDPSVRIGISGVID
ncbi:MAG: YadA-like family protein [Acinetobacter sp.]